MQGNVTERLHSVKRITFRQESANAGATNFWSKKADKTSDFSFIIYSEMIDCLMTVHFNQRFV
jgi:hypothetical protein